MSIIIKDVRPSATPTNDEIAAWNALPRDVQVERTREELNHPDCGIISNDTMEDILALAKQRASERRRG